MLAVFSTPAHRPDMRSKLTALGIGFFLCVSAARAQVVWNFTAGTGAPSSLSSDITGGTITASNLSSGSLAFNSTSASSGYSGATGGNNASVTAKTGALATATSTYFEFTLTPASGNSISATALSLGSRSTGSGPTTLSLYSSVDNYTSLLGSVSVSANSSWASVTLSAFSVSGATNTAITFRLFGSGGSGTVGSGNWRIDDMSLSASAIPEPSTYAVFFGAFALAGAVWKRRQKRLVG
jgi:hypothetical protein